MLRWWLQCHNGKSHRLFCLPKNDKLRNVWLSYLVPTNSLLIGLTKEQLLRKRVCEKHFDSNQFDGEGRRLRFSYPYLLTSKEIAHGAPLSTSEWNVKIEHNYTKEQDEEDVIGPEPAIVKIATNCLEHNYSKKQDESIAIESSLVTAEADVILEQPSCSGIGVNIEIMPDTMQRTEQSQSQEQKGPSIKRLGSKKRKLIKQVLNITTDSLHDSPSQRLTEAQTLLNKSELLDKFSLLNKQAKTFLLMQCKQVGKPKMARRFTVEEKLMALLLMKQSPKGYKLLEKMLNALPNKRTLLRLSEKVSMEPGLNHKIFDYIAHSCKNWDLQQKLCTIVFDEVALTPQLTFNEKKEKIHGFVDVAGERKMRYCDHALVFMIRGICSPWRQSIAYYFCEGTVSSAELQNILKQIVSQVALTGLIPLGLVCDQGSTFRTAMRQFREDTIHLRNLKGVHDDGSINIAGHDLSLFYDPPHLLKGLRNNFLTKDIIWNGSTAKWKDIEYIYDIDSKLGHTRALPKLTAHHVDPKKVKKMKVSVAAQVLSNRTAAMLKYTNALNNLRNNESENTMGTTAEVVEFFDTLFDSVNGYPGGAKRGKLRRAVKKNSPHHLFWAEAIQKIKNINFLDKCSKLAAQSGKPRLVRVPSLQGWITSLESFIRISKLLFDKYSVDYFYPRLINQDPLENFFGRIRALNYRNINPDANTFIYAFKSLMLSNVLSPHSKFSNCEEDNGETILDVGFLFKTDNENKENYTSSPPSSSQDYPREKLTVDQVVMEKIKVHCSAYTAGYICRKISKSIRCNSCLKTYTSSLVEKVHTYIQFREYKTLKNNNLSYPTERLLILYRDVAQLVHNYLNDNCYKNNIKSNLVRKILSTMRFSWLGCSKHNNEVKNLFIQVLIRLQVHNWCNIINKILKGDVEAKYVAKMGEPQKRALDKYKRFRLRKRCLSK